MPTSQPSSASVTIHDVAAHAGVSIATVSRALSGSRPMSEELRQKVLHSANELGYQVNLVGRALRQKKTATLGLVLPDLENPFFSALAQQVSRRFSPLGTDVLVISADNDIELESRAIRSFLGRQVDGLVMIPCDEIRSAPSVQMASSSVPTVQFDRLVPNIPIPYVGCDNAAGIDLVFHHIKNSVNEELQPVIYVGGGQSTSSGRERLHSVIQQRPQCAVYDGSFSFNWGREAAKSILNDGIVTGTIVTAADVIALGVTSWLVSQGFNVPGDFRVIGFDDLGVSFLAHPTLTTVSQPLEQMTEAIFSYVTSEHAAQSEVRHQIFKPQLIIRESSPGCI